MQELDDIGLLREYVERDSEEAFATLIERHINKVHSVALRHTGNPHQAEEITQAVFVILARKARQLSRGVILYSWLYKTARLTSAAFIRGEIRRTRREQEACMQNVNETSEPEVWPQIAPLLDSALAALNETDRRALILRFFYDKSMREIGADLGANEDAIKKRVNRALEKLQHYFLERGVHSTTAMLAGTVSACSVQAAPTALAKSVTDVALAKGATASISTLTLIKGALKIMAWTKMKTAVVSGVVVLLAAGTTTVTVKEVAAHRNEVWREKYDLSVLNRIPQQVKILAAVSSRRGGTWGGGSPGMMGLGVRVADIVQSAYGGTLGRMIFSVPLPGGNYDFISSFHDGADTALQQEIQKKFELIARRELIETNVLVLTVRDHNAAGLRTSSATAGETVANRDRDSGSYQCKNEPISNLVGFLEDYLGTPVVDQTGLTDNYDIVLIGDHTREGLKRVVLKELGLELVPGREPIEYLVVERTSN
jgi:uncharacterized protein (TIGR03435 family)